MKIKILLLVFLVGMTKISIAQVLIKNEKINKRTYTLQFKNNLQYKIKNINGKKIINFPFYADPSKSGQFILPSKNLFIPIPPKSKPTAKLLILKKEQIHAIPEINPKAVLINDSTIGYSISKLTELKQESDIVNKGYLWIGNKYYINLKVRLFEYSYSGFVVANKRFHIVLKFKNNLIFSEKKKVINQNKFTMNSKFKFQTSKSIRKYPANNNDSWIDYSKTYLKLGVAKDAIYRISKNDLADYGINVSLINPQTFKLFLKGKEIPIYVSGENDGTFNNSDFIEFAGIKNYGDKDYRDPANFNEPYNEFMNIYSDTSIYFLTWDGNYGKRIDTLLNYSSTTSDTLDYYDKFLHFEKNLWYDFSLSGGEVRRQNPNIYENETWDWWVQGNGTHNFNFNVSNLKSGKVAKAYLKIQSWATNLYTKAHNLSLHINSISEPLDSTFVDKYEDVTLSGSFQSDNLHDGNNNLKLISYDTGANPNSCFGDWWEVEYPRLIKTNNDSLLFGYRNLTSKKFAVIKITGLTVNNFSLYKLVDNKPVAKITNYNFNTNSLTFNDTVSNGTTYIITSANKISKPKYYYKKQFVNLRNSSNKADYILITHPLFLSTAQNYVSFIQDNYNVTAKVINVFDIYDEFNFGFLAPEPIKEFLMMTQDNWQAPHPKYVFLVGKPTYDFHGYKTKYFGAPAQINFVLSYGNPISDNWFVMWDSTNSHIPQIDIGRLPVISVEEFQHYFNKHQNYLHGKFDKWNKRYLFLSGGNFTDESQLLQLRGSNDFIINNYVKPKPIGGLPKHFYKTSNPVTNFGPFSQTEIQNTFDKGGLFISYLGHSGTQTWDNSISDAHQLINNLNRNPLISDFGCSTGKFAEPDVVSFSEEFIDKPYGQAIAYVANSSLGFLSTAIIFPKIFYRTFLKDLVLNIGDAHRLAKIEMINQYGSGGVFGLFAMTNSLVGDPIINLRIPQKPNLFIDNQSVSFSSKLPSDIMDSTSVKFVYFNLGTVTNDSIKISLTDIYNGNKIVDASFERQLPLYKDSLIVKIPIKNKPGSHQIKFKLDSENSVHEIYEDDNIYETQLNVLSGSIKLLNNYSVENEITNKLKFINPVVNPNASSFNIELSESQQFNNVQTFQVQFDTLISQFAIPATFKNKRFWLRAKLPNSEDYGRISSFYSGDKNGYLLNDSLSFSSPKINNLINNKNMVGLDSLTTKFSVISAGFNDGNTAFVLKNGQNFIPENTLRGHHVVVFEDSTYNFVTSKLFDLLGGGASTAQEYINFLDTLSSNYIVCFAVKDEGKISLTNNLKNKIKEFGSVDIDSLVFRGSWAFIGKKGAVPGSMPEAFSKPFEGRVQVDTSITKLNKTGNLLTSQIGPVSIWQKLTVSDFLPSDSKINYRILGIKSDSEIDTLNYVTVNNGQADLSYLNNVNYSYIKVLADFNASTDLLSPQLKSLGVSYTGVPELGTNYQVVSIEKDTLKQGENVNLSFYVYNVGEFKADSFMVKVDLVKTDNSRTNIFEQVVDSLGSDSRTKFNVSLSTVNLTGNYSLNISIDSDNKVLELYEDNNFYSVPFTVNGDSSKPTLNITFDGNDLIDGDYISSNPKIQIQLDDPSLIPITDTSSIDLFLNNQRINYLNNSNVDIAFSQQNPKVVVNYTPKLKSGRYQLTVFGKNANGFLSDSAGVTKSFVVDDEAKLLDVYNYPNPAENETYFTFRLPVIPDEMKINVYTIAGRLVKKFDIVSSELNLNFNKILWNLRDEDGDKLANGVYLYKISMKSGDKSQQFTQKLAIVR